MSTTTFKLVMPEHLNHYGFLFGGHLLKWVDEVAWMAASRDYPGCAFLTVGMDRVEFRKRAGNGDILRFEAVSDRRGRTSIQYRVTVFRQPPDGGAEELIFTTAVTQVRVDEAGRKQLLPPAPAKTAKDETPG